MYTFSRFHAVISFFIFICSCISIANAAPPAPDLLFPNDNAILLNDGTIELDWQDAAGATGYKVVADYSANLQSPEVQSSPVGSAANLTLSANGVYYWSAQGRDASGAWGNWATVSKFCWDSRPAPPALTSPVLNESFNQGATVSFIWGNSPDTPIERYYLRVVQGTNFNNTPIFQEEIKANSKSVSTAGWPSGTYTWGVRAIKTAPEGFDQLAYEQAINWGTYNTRTFTISVAPPPPPTLTTPGNGATLDDSTPDLSWSTGGASVNYFHVQIARNSAFTDLVVDEANWNTFNFTPTSLSDGSYWWRVRSHGTNNEWSNWASRYFILSTTASATVQKPFWVPLFRLYNSQIKDHYYTTIPAHRDNAIAQKNYLFEKVECYLSDRPFGPDSKPLYGLYSASLNTHFYTSDDTVRTAKLAAGFQDEGIVGYLYSSANDDAFPLAQLEHIANTDNFYTINSFEYDNATQYLGFANRGIVGWVSASGLDNPRAHIRPQANFGGVDLGTGAFRGLNSLDLSLQGKGPELFFRHSYNSFNFNRYPMGPGWSHNLFASIIEDVVDATGNVYIEWGDGTISHFEKTGPGTKDYLDKSGNQDRLERYETVVDYGFDLIRKDQTTYRFRKLTPNYQKEESIVLLSIDDWKGNSLTFNYSGETTTVSDGMGRSLQLHYASSNGLLDQVSEMVGSETKRSVSFTYSPEGLLETFVDANGKTTRYAYFNEPNTARHQLLKSVTYPMGNTIEVDYDANQASGSAGRVTAVKNSGQKTATIAYTPSSNLTTVTDPEQNAVQYLHPSNMLTAFKGSADSAWTTIERTDSRHPHLPTRVTDQKGYLTQYAYDAVGNVVKVTNARGMVATYSYNARNNITSSREFHDPAIAPPPPTTYGYDQDGNRLISVTNPEMETVYIGYTVEHEVQSISDGRGFVTTFAYDDFGNLRQITDAEDNVTNFDNDYAGRTLAVTDAAGIKTSFTYDNTDHPKDILDYAKGAQSVIRTVSRLYDANGNLDTVQWTNEGVLSRTRYLYDNRDRLSVVRKPNGNEKRFTYLGTDQVNTRTDFSGKQTGYAYDKHNRLERILYPDGTSVVTERDDNGNVIAVSGPNGTSAFPRDNLNRMESYRDPYGKTVGYSYDAAGRISSITYPGNRVVQYGYDLAGRLETVSDWAGGTMTYVYDDAGNLTEARRSNGLRTVYGYDLAARLTSITEKNGANATLWSYTYDLDAVGNHRSVDAVNEPLTFTAAAEEVQYTADKASNELLAAGTATYSYDANGNRKSRVDGGVTTEYTWDHENMLTRVTTTGQPNIEYRYDAMGNRIAKLVNGVATRYVLDLNSDMSRVLAETDGNGTVTAYYIYGLGLVSRIDAGGSRRFYHANHRGDTVALSNDAGTVTDTYAYGEYGEVHSDPGNTNPNPYTYVGQFGVMNEGNDMFFMRARIYDAKVGRFLSEDSLGFSGGDWNLNAYVAGNPITLIDANGKKISISGILKVLAKIKDLKIKYRIQKMFIDFINKLKISWKKSNDYSNCVNDFDINSESECSKEKNNWLDSVNEANKSGDNLTEELSKDMYKVYR